MNNQKAGYPFNTKRSQAIMHRAHHLSLPAPCPPARDPRHLPAHRRGKLELPDWRWPHQPQRSQATSAFPPPALPARPSLSPRLSLLPSFKHIALDNPICRSRSNRIRLLSAAGNVTVRCWRGASVGYRFPFRTLSATLRIDRLIQFIGFHVVASGASLIRWLGSWWILSCKNRVVILSSPSVF